MIVFCYMLCRIELINHTSFSYWMIILLDYRNLRAKRMQYFSKSALKQATKLSSFSMMWFSSSWLPLSCTIQWVACSFRSQEDDYAGATFARSVAVWRNHEIIWRNWLQILWLVSSVFNIWKHRHCNRYAVSLYRPDANDRGVYQCLQ